VPRRPGVAYLVAQYRIWRGLTEAFDAIHVFHPAFGLAGLVEQQLRNTPLVVSLMGYDTYAFGRMSRVKQAIALAACRRADAVLAPSHDLARIAGGLGVETHIEVIPHGIHAPTVDPARVNELRRSLRIPPGTTVCVAVQRHYAIKDPMIFLETWKQLRQASHHLVLVGGGELEPMLRRWAAEWGLDNIHIVGEVPHEDVPAYLSLAHIFVHHSHYESFGVGILEAMQMGVPVIACDVGAVPEIITDGVDGLLIPPSNPAAMAQAVTRMADSPDLRAGLAAAGRRRASELGWQRLADRYTRIYEGTCHPRGPTVGVQ
jgi:glycosyltransferase involved in cell wall biosynthesis